MAKKRMTLEEFQAERELNQRLWGKDSSIGGYYACWLPHYERKLAEAESWLRTNPNNEFNRARVEMLRKRVEEFRRGFEHSP